MNCYDFVHLVILAAGGKIEGRTKLQKIVYFAGVLTGDIKRLGYRPHYYGPYSPDVAGAVQELRGLKFLDQTILSRGAADENGFEKVRYDYVLTREGTELAKEKAAHHAVEWKRIAEAVAKLRSANVQDYVRLAIAAKTDLLNRQAGRELPDEVLREKAAEHGWKEFTGEQYAEAVQFLKTVVGTRSQAAQLDEQ